MHGSNVQTRVATGVPVVNVAAELHQDFDSLGLAVLDGGEQRSVA